MERVLHIAKSPEDFTASVAQWIEGTMDTALQKKERFTWALSGGNTPKGIYELLSSTPYRSKLPWQKLHFFFGDERGVPFKDPRSNAKMAYDAMLNHVSVPASQIHVMRTDIDYEKSARQYETLLREYFPTSDGNFPLQSFDLVLLGLGGDGHTLSLFPGMPVVEEEKKWVVAYYLPAQDMYRITLTARLVNRSSKVAFLATGLDKADAVRQVLEGPYLPKLLPSQIIQPAGGQLHWFLDEAAASRLS